MVETVWYHGTRAGFRGAGGLLLPRAQTGSVGTAAPLNPGRQSPADADEWCFITRDVDVAWAYAEHAPGRAKPRVLVVEPSGVVERDPEHGWRTDAWRCRAATVRAVLTARE